MGTNGEGSPVPPSDDDDVEQPRRNPAPTQDADMAEFRQFQEWRRRIERGRRSARQASDDEEDTKGASGPPPSWDGSSNFEDFCIKARLWIHTTKVRPKARGPLLLKALTGEPFENFKHLAKDASWLNDSKNAETLLNTMDQPEFYGDDQQEHLLAALSRITYHMKRGKTETWREYFTRWDTAMRKVSHHNVKLPPQYEGFLIVNGLQLTDAETKAMLNFTHGDIEPKSIKEWLRKSEAKLGAHELGVEKNHSTKKNANQILLAENITDDEPEIDHADPEINELETLLAELHGEERPEETESDPPLEESETAEILSTILQNKKKTFAQTFRLKKEKEIGRGYNRPRNNEKGKGKGTNFVKTNTDYKMTISELKKRTRCAKCRQVGHWHRECPNAEVNQNSKELHFMEREFMCETSEAAFCGLLESEPVGAMTSASSAEPLLREGNLSSLSETGRANLLNTDDESRARYNIRFPLVDDVYSLFFFEGELSRNTPKIDHIPDSSCATIDTGCQRLAIGQRTLEKLQEHIPNSLKIFLKPELNRFRSVHDTSTTSHVAIIPCALGPHGCFLKPAVFQGTHDNDTSSQAPFLLSLPFLRHCGAVLILDRDQGLQLRLNKVNFQMPCHIGPSGALRVPLTQYTARMLTKLHEKQEKFKHVKGQEFEVFQVQATTKSESRVTNRSRDDGDRQQTFPQREPDYEQSHDLGPTGSEAHSLADPCQHLVGKFHEASQPLQECRVGPCEPDGQGRIGEVEKDYRLENSKDLHRERIQTDPGLSRHRLGDGVIEEPEYNNLERPVHDGRPTWPEAQGQDRQGWRCSRTRSDVRPSSDLPLSQTGPFAPESHSQELRKDVLQLRRPEVQLLSVDRQSATPGPDHMEVQGTTRTSTLERCRDPSALHPGEVYSWKNHKEWDKCTYQHGNVPHMRKDPEERTKTEGIQDNQCCIQQRDYEQSGSCRVRGISELPPLAAHEQEQLRLQESIQPLPDKVARRLKSSLKKTAGFWNQIHLMFCHHGVDDDAASRTIQKLNAEILQEVQTNPKGTKRGHQLAEIFHMSYGQLRTVAEVFNPGCFGKVAKKFNLIEGMAFDIELGHNLLDPQKRQQVRNYLRHVKPGLVLIAPPCKMYSSLQNLNKHRREGCEETMKTYIRNRREASILLHFAIEICELCLELGLRFVLEHPWTATSWKDQQMKRLLRDQRVRLQCADQCRYGLHGDQGPQKKTTGFLVNDMSLADFLSKRCEGDHKHEHIIGGNRSRRAQEYPQALIEGILRTYSKTIQQPAELYLFEEIFREDQKRDRRLRECWNHPTEEKEILANEDANDLPDLVPPGEESDDDQHVPPERDLQPDHDLPQQAPPDREVPGAQEVEDSGHRDLPLSSRFTLKQLIKRAHEGLGHPNKERFLRILRFSKAKKEVLEAAQQLQCSVCERSKQVKPSRRAAPPRELGVNEVVGADVIYLPTSTQRSRPALNLVDWGTKFQMMIPLSSKSPDELRRAYRHWLRFLGAPKTLTIDQGKEFVGVFAMRAESDGTYVDVAALETPQQRSITERAGKSFKQMFLKAMDQYPCESEEDWEELVDTTAMMKNRLMLKSGFSPVQRVLGYATKIPGGIMSDDANNEAHNHKATIGDLGIEKAMKMRKAAALAFFETDCDEALRRAITSGPRPLEEYQVGESVYFWRKGKDKARKTSPEWWHGPAKVLMTDPPSTVWVAYQGTLVKASPERLRRCSEDEAVTLTGWIDDLLNTKQEFDKLPTKGYIELSSEPLPPDTEEDQGDLEYTPSMADPEEVRAHQEKHQLPRIYPAPTKRYRTKGPQELPDIEPELPVESELPEILPEVEQPEQEELVQHGEKRDHDEEEEIDEPPTKKTRTELLEIFHAKVEALSKLRQKKEVRLNEMSVVNKHRFHKAMSKEVTNNLNVGAYEKLTIEESARIRKEEPTSIMESRFVLTAKPLEEHEVEQAKADGILLDWTSGEPCKAKARHVMKGYSEQGAEWLESTTPQVTREGAMFTLQLISSHHWRLGSLDFTQAFHSGDAIDRTIYMQSNLEKVYQECNLVNCCASSKHVTD